MTTGRFVLWMLTLLIAAGIFFSTPSRAAFAIGLGLLFAAFAVLSRCSPSDSTHPHD